MILRSLDFEFLFTEFAFCLKSPRTSYSKVQQHIPGGITCSSLFIECSLFQKQRKMALHAPKITNEYIK